MKYFLLPPLNLFVLAALGWLLARRWRRVGHALVVVAGIALVALSLPFVASWMMQPLQIYPPLDPERIPADVGAIVILSADTRPAAREYGSDIVGPATLERVRYGAYLHRLTGKPVLVTGGRIIANTTTLAQQMRDVLASDFNVPVRWIEARSTNTHENAVYSSEILRRDGVKTVLLVTHAWHMRRAMAAFRATHLHPIAAPTRFISEPAPILLDFMPNALSLRTSSYAIHEWIGLLWYYVAGYTHSFS